MKFASVRLVAAQLEPLLTFYATVTGVTPTRRSPDFAELHVGGLVLALSTERMIQQFNQGLAVAAANRSALLEFEVTDVEEVHQRARAAQLDVAMPPTTMPWGNRSMLLRDPEGTVVNVFSRPT